jgi:hypothetical protein
VNFFTHPLGLLHARHTKHINPLDFAKKSFYI